MKFPWKDLAQVVVGASAVLSKVEIEIYSNGEDWDNFWVCEETVKTLIRSEFDIKGFKGRFKL